MARHCVKSGCHIPLAVNQSRYITAMHHSAFKTIVALQIFHFMDKSLGFFGRYSHRQVALDTVAVNLVPGNTLVNQVKRFNRHVPGFAGCILAQLVFKGFLAAGVPHNGLAAIATRSTAANSVCFQNHHAVAFFSQMQRT